MRCDGPRRDIARTLMVRRGLFLVDEADGRIVGSVMAGCEGHRGWINDLALHPDARRRGHATRLMAAAQALLLEAGRPEVDLQVRSSNGGAVAFDEKLGFTRDEVVSLGKRLVPDTDPRTGPLAPAPIWVVGWALPPMRTRPRRRRLAEGPRAVALGPRTRGAAAREAP